MCRRSEMIFGFFLAVCWSRVAFATSYPVQEYQIQLLAIDSLENRYMVISRLAERAASYFNYSISYSLDVYSLTGNRYIESVPLWQCQYQNTLFSTPEPAWKRTITFPDLRPTVHYLAPTVYFFVPALASLPEVIISADSDGVYFSNPQSSDIRRIESRWGSEDRLAPGIATLIVLGILYFGDSHFGIHSKSDRQPVPGEKLQSIVETPNGSHFFVIKRETYANFWITESVHAVCAADLDRQTIGAVRFLRVQGYRGVWN